MECRTATLTRRELKPRSVELARHGYRSGDEAELAVQAYEAREMAPCDSEPSA